MGLRFDSNLNESFKSQYKNKHAGLLNSTRTNAVYFQSRNKWIWAATVNGLLCFKPNKVIDTITYQGQSILGLDIIETPNKEIWVASSNGVYVLKNGKVKTKIDGLNGLHRNKVKKLIYHDKFVHCLTSSGIQSFHESEYYFDYILTKKEGLPSNDVIDAGIFHDTLYILTANGVHEVCINDLKKRLSSRPNLFLFHVRKNGKNIADLEKIEYGFNQLEFQFEVISPNSAKNYIVAYNISKTNNYQYNYLEKCNSKLILPNLYEGEYNLHVKVIDLFGRESELLSIPFSVQPPVYRAWWFYLAISTLIVVLITLFFMIRLKIVRKRLTLEKKIKSSEITAIKSQMNPHFIFNALNSIQELILQKDVRNSNIYLGRFA
jgi:hypothetical protein